MAGRGGEWVLSECLLLFGLVHLEGGFGVKTRKQSKIALCSWDCLAKTARAVCDSWLRRADGNSLWKGRLVGKEERCGKQQTVAPHGV